jgi:uncharacterized membrane protein YtjA (UPF0391 family)
MGHARLLDNQLGWLAAAGHDEPAETSPKTVPCVASITPNAMAREMRIASLRMASSGRRIRRIRSRDARVRHYLHSKGFTMLRWALLFLLVALIAGAFGLWGPAGLAMTIARVLFFVFLVLLVVSLVLGRRSPLT